MQLDRVLRLFSCCGLAAVQQRKATVKSVVGAAMAMVGKVVGDCENRSVIRIRKIVGCSSGERKGWLAWRWRGQRCGIAVSGLLELALDLFE